MVTIEELLGTAKERGASDLHVTVGIPPKIRVNGELEDMDYPCMLPADVEALIKPTMSAQVQQAFRERGEMDYAYSIPGLGRYRVNVFRQKGTIAFVMRLVGTMVPQAFELGIPDSVVELTKKKRGLVLVTGPAGSGKSTTLASLIDIINTNYNSHIITLEDPIEYLHNHKKSIVNQREIGFDTRGYARALRSALREDPDVILVGEMRDLDTVLLAIMAAETGHLVFSTLHTIGAVNTIDRVIDIFPPHQQPQIRSQLAGVLKAVVSQQLIPLQNGGGRVAAFEVMTATVAVKNLIREAKTYQIDSIIQTSGELGMQTMDDAIYELYLKRKIGVDQVLTFAQDPAALERKLY